MNFIDVDIVSIKGNVYIYVIMKTLCPPGYHHNGFVATHALGHMMYSIYIIIKIIVKQKKPK